MQSLNLRYVANRGFVRTASTIPKKLKSHYDIIISGGGLVGTAAACAIASDPVLRKCSILLVEPREPALWRSVPSQYSNRVYSITPGTRRLLEEISAWPMVEKLRHKTVRRLQVWEAASDAAISFEPRLDQEVSYIIEEPVLSTALWSRLRQLTDEVDIIHGTSAKAYSLPCRKGRIGVHDNKSVKPGAVSSVEGARGPEEVDVMMSDGQKVSASLLIGADGYSSAVRGAMGVQYISWNYDQKGIVATVYLSELQENSTAWQRFTSAGPIALLPLDEKSSSLVWSTSSEEADRLLKLSDEEFLDALNRSIWDDQGKTFAAGTALKLLDRVLNPFGLGVHGMHQLPPTLTAMEAGSRAAFPLSLGHASQYVSPSVVLIGDAAHRLHPLAGLGVNLGFGDVLSLRGYLREAITCGYDINSMTHLLRYEADCQRRVLPIMAAVDGLKRLYSTNWNPLVVLRSVGLSFFDSVSPLKRQIIKFASR